MAPYEPLIVQNGGASMDYREAKERQARSRRRWNLIAFILFLIAPPAGVGVFIANKLDILPNIGGSVDLNSCPGIDSPAATACNVSASAAEMLTADIAVSAAARSAIIIFFMKQKPPIL